MSPARTHLDELDELVGGAVLEDEVAHRRAVAGNVAERPDALLAHVDARRRQQADERGHSAVGDDDLALLARAARNIGQAPRGLELHRRLGVSEHCHLIHCRLHIMDCLWRSKTFA